MASAFGVRLDPKVDTSGELTTRIDFDPYRLGAIDALIERWVPLASLMNNLNRAIGQRDAYPFVLTPAVIAKLAFILETVRDAGRHQWTVPGPRWSAADQHALRMIVHIVTKRWNTPGPLTPRGFT